MYILNILLRGVYVSRLQLQRKRTKGKKDKKKRTASKQIIARGFEGTETVVKSKIEPAGKFGKPNGKTGKGSCFKRNSYKLINI